MDFFPEMAMELLIVLDYFQLHRNIVHQSLEETVSKMVNLVTLCIRLQSDCALEDFESYRPVLNGLRSCQNLKAFILNFDGQVGGDPGWARFIDFDTEEENNGETMLNFMDMVVTNCPNITK